LHELGGDKKKMDLPLPTHEGSNNLEIFDPQIEFMVNPEDMNALEVPFWARVIEHAPGASRKSNLKQHYGSEGLMHFHWYIDCQGPNENKEDQDVKHMFLRSSAQPTYGLNEEADSWEVAVYDRNTHEELASVPAEYVGHKWDDPEGKLSVSEVAGGIVKFSILASDWNPPGEFNCLQQWGYVRIKEYWTLPSDTGYRMSGKWNNTLFKAGGYFK